MLVNKKFAFCAPFRGQKIYIGGNTGMNGQPVYLA